jgi:hypothetical protein
MITENRFVVEAATMEDAACVWACLGDAARALWWRSVGARVEQGAVMARGDEIVHLTGASRMGASLTALGLWRRGWSLICDGVIPLLDDIVMPTASAIEVDPSALPLVGNPHAEVLPTGRPRVAVPVRGHDAASITHTVRVRPRVAPIAPSTRQTGDEIVCEWGWCGDRERQLKNLPIRVAEAIEVALR